MTMTTVGKYLQTWKLKLSATKTVSAVFHLNNKEAEREVKVIFNNETLPFCSEPEYLGVTLDSTLTYRRPLESLRKKLTSCVALFRWISGWGAGATTLRITILFNSRELLSCLVPQCLIDPVCHERRYTNCDWMPASCTSGQPSNPRGHPTCWASSQRSHFVASTPCY